MKTLAKRLGQISTLYYVLIYLFLIFIFASIYYFLPDRSFYHSTSKFEYSELNEDASDILTNIRKCIIRSNTQFYSDSIITLSCWKVNINHLNINSLNVDNFPKEISFRMNIRIEHVKGIVTILSPNIKIDIQEKSISEDMVFCTVHSDYNLINISNEFKYPKIDSFFRISEDKGMQFLEPTIVLTSDLWSKMVYFGQAYRGFPNNSINGQWFRMLYLSAGIATSTLIGDIVPITVLSRFIITLQGLLTLIIISLFFNALAFDISFMMKKSKVNKTGKKSKTKKKNGS